MRKVSLAKKYTKALSESIKDKNEFDLIKNDLELFLAFSNTDEKLKAGMETMLFSVNQKLEILDLYNSKAKLNEKTYNFLKVIIENNRISYLDTMIEMMEEQWYESKGVQKFVLYSAVPLEIEQEQRLKDKLGIKLKCDVVFEKKIDPSLIAGIKLKKGSIFYDFSIEGNLKKLRESLIGENSI